MTVSGVNFGVLDLTLTAKLLATLCDTTQWSSTTGLMCVVAAGAGAGTLLSLSVTSTALVGTATDVFTYDGAKDIPFSIHLV